MNVRDGKEPLETNAIKQNKPKTNSNRPPKKCFMLLPV
jgi:hypothetical protein